MMKSKHTEKFFTPDKNKSVRILPSVTIISPFMSDFKVDYMETELEYMRKQKVQMRIRRLEANDRERYIEVILNWTTT